MVALMRVSERLFGLLIHISGVARLLNILLVSGSMSAYFVTFNALFSSRFLPLVLGERVNLNTIGAGVLSFVVVWFCFAYALCSSSNLLVGVKYCCMFSIVCALLHSWQ